MRKISCPILIAACISLGVQTGRADIILATPAFSNATSITTMDGLVTLNPLDAGLVPGNFGPSTSAFFGVNGGGNSNAIGDLDGDPSTTGDRQAIDVLLDATVGLSQMEFRWTRSDGPLATDGIQISGFLADPVVSSPALPGNVTLSYSAGSVYINHGWNGGTDTTFDFANLAASAGQTLRIGANDSDQGGSQAAIHSISYAVIPEPSTIALLALGMGVALLRRRR